MSHEKKGLSGPTQLVLLGLALLPVWYFVVRQLGDNSTPDEVSPYYMACPECGLKYFCGPKGLPGMICLRCADPKPVLQFRTSSVTDFSDVLVRVFMGVISLLAVVVLIVGGHRPKKKAAKEETAPAKDPEAKQAALNEMNKWARDLVENRRRRMEG
jgi:hypothetical protein